MASILVGLLNWYKYWEEEDNNGVTGENAIQCPSFFLLMPQLYMVNNLEI